MQTKQNRPRGGGGKKTRNALNISTKQAKQGPLNTPRPLRVTAPRFSRSVKHSPWVRFGFTLEPFTRAARWLAAIGRFF